MDNLILSVLEDTPDSRDDVEVQSGETRAVINNSTGETTTLQSPDSLQRGAPTRMSVPQ